MGLPGVAPQTAQGSLSVRNRRHRPGVSHQAATEEHGVGCPAVGDRARRGAAGRPHGGAPRQGPDRAPPPTRKTVEVLGFVDERDVPSIAAPVVERELKLAELLMDSLAGAEVDEPAEPVPAVDLMAAAGGTLSALANWGMRRKRVV